MYMKTIEELEKQLTEISEQIKELKNKPKPEVGKWYKSKRGSIINWQETGKHYGISVYNSWHHNDLWNFVESDLTPATPEEVKAALVKEAEKRGFKEGVRIKTAKGNSAVLGKRLDFIAYDNMLAGDCDFIGRSSIFNNGQWAEIIKDDVIKVGSYKVCKNGSDFEIGCRTIQKSNVQYFKDFMISKNFKTISFDGVETDLETIEKILSL